MNNLWKKIGILAFWVSLPGLYVYLRSSRRARVLIVSEDKVLLVKGWLGTGKWMLPGGGLHGDEDPAEGAVREVLEETGLVLLPSNLTLLGAYQYRNYGLRYMYELFATELPAAVDIKPGDKEITAFTWLPIEQLGSVKTEQDIQAALDTWKGLQ